MDKTFGLNLRLCHDCIANKNGSLYSVTYLDVTRYYQCCTVWKSVNLSVQKYSFLFLSNLSKLVHE